MPVPRLYVPGLESTGGTVELPPGEAHHATRVLRLRPGYEVRVFDGRGREWAARLAVTGGRRASTIEMLQEVAPVPEPPVRVTLGVGILKGDHMDAVVRDATMMGAAAIAPIVSAHVTVPQKAWKSVAAVERWHRVAVASAKQCGRAVVPEISPPADFETVLARHAGEATLMFLEPSAGASAMELAKIDRSPPGRALILIGPEGGWDANEVNAARRAGATLVHLGPRTIRADAMATVAMSALWTVWQA